VESETGTNIVDDGIMSWPAGTNDAAVAEEVEVVLDRMGDVSVNHCTRKYISGFPVLILILHRVEAT
jgi:hypothetical protein